MSEIPDRPKRVEEWLQKYKHVALPEVLRKMLDDAFEMGYGDGASSSEAEIPGKTVYAILIEDRHTDPDVEVWLDKDAAIARAREAAIEIVAHPDALEEAEEEGYILRIEYQLESDSVTVLERKIQPD
jgi:hypothetical protein